MWAWADGQGSNPSLPFTGRYIPTLQMMKLRHEEIQYPVHKAPWWPWGGVMVPSAVGLGGRSVGVEAGGPRALDLCP